MIGTAQSVRLHGALDFDRSSGSWILRDMPPHVAIRVKRLLPGVEQDRGGTVTISHSLNTARDLEWVLQRYPMQVPLSLGQWLEAQAERGRGQEAAMESILNGVPSSLGVRTPARQPYPYQLKSADLAMTTGRLLIGDDMGLGKSFTSLLTLRAPDALPALVVTLAHLPRQWVEKELAETYPGLLGHVIRSTKVYDPTEACGGQTPGLLAISYSKLPFWADYLAGGRIKTIIFDEIHELRHSASDRYKGAARAANDATYRVGLSGTPVYNYGGEIWNIYDVIAPGELGTKDEFQREWCEPGESRKLVVKDPAALGSWLRDQGLFIAHRGEDVGRKLPPPQYIVQPVHSDVNVFANEAGNAAEMARLILNKNAVPRDRNLLGARLDQEIRQATGIAKAPFVAEYVRFLLQGTQRILLVGWHRPVYDIWLERLAAFNPVLYTGTETTSKKEKAVEQFLYGDSRVMMMSLRSGVGLDGLQSGCDTVVFGEYDWSPQVHAQVVARLRRPGLKGPVRAYFCASQFGSDPPMTDLLEIKRMQNDPLVDPRAKFVKPTAPTQRHVDALAWSILQQTGQAMPVG